VRINLSGGTPAEIQVPPMQALRGLVIAPDVMGLRPLFDEHVRRLSEDNGWAVVAVEPYPGQGDLPLEERLAGRLDDRRIMDDLVAAGDELRQRADVERVAVLGFCMGGMHAFKAAGTGKFDRAVAFYGMIRPPEQWSTPGNDPLEALARPEACPTLAILGGVDKWTPPADIEALRNVGSHVTVRLYEDADHGFVHDPSRPAHRADDAADAWRWVIDFLA
jgi:dienelactone hydrolase